MNGAVLNPRPVPEKPHTRVLTVPDEDGDVTVHWHYRRGPDQPQFRFNCSACGHADYADGCAHTFAAALRLADALLGLRAKQ